MCYFKITLEIYPLREAHVLQMETFEDTHTSVALNVMNGNQETIGYTPFCYKEQKNYGSVKLFIVILRLRT